MKYHIFGLKFLCFSLVALSMTACIKKNKSNNFTQTTTSTVTENTETEEPVQKINPDAIKVYSIKVSQVQERRTLSEFLTLDVHAMTDFTRFYICPMDHGRTECTTTDGVETCNAVDNCSDHILSYEKFKIPILKAGAYELKAEACIYAEKSTIDDGSLFYCGGQKTHIYQSKNLNEELAELYSEFEEAASIVEDQTLAYKAALETYVREAETCQLENAEHQKLLDSKKRVVELLIRKPEEFFAQGARLTARTLAGSEEAGDKLLDSINDMGSDIVNEVKGWCDNDPDKKHGKGVLCATGAVGSQMLQGLAPVHTVQNLSNSIHNIYASLVGKESAIVPLQCNAESNLSLRTSAIEAALSIAKKRLEDVKEKLINLGHLVERPPN